MVFPLRLVEGLAAPHRESLACNSGRMFYKQLGRCGGTRVLGHGMPRVFVGPVAYSFITISGPNLRSSSNVTRSGFILKN
jgi:hypothetical protein